MVLVVRAFVRCVGAVDMDNQVHSAPRKSEYRTRTARSRKSVVRYLSAGFCCPGTGWMAYGDTSVGDRISGGLVGHFGAARSILD
jgi:hypothetical protein